MPNNNIIGSQGFIQRYFIWSGRGCGTFTYSTPSLTLNACARVTVVVLCVCLSVRCLSVTALAATYLVYTLKAGYH